MNHGIFAADFKSLHAALLTELAETEKLLLNTPDGTLNKIISKDGNILYNQRFSENGIIKKVSANNNPNLLAALARKGYLKKKAEILEKDIHLIESILPKYTVPSPDNIIASLGKQYSGLDNDLFFCNQSGDIWANESYEQSDYLPDGKTITTSRGLKVRSKSEALIAEMLYEYHIQFRYEQVFHGFDGKSYIPDFTIRRTDGKMYYWEHCGMTSDKNYMERHKQKIASYEKYGIAPWDNLIVSYDDADGNINLKIVKAEIEGKLLS